MAMKKNSTPEVKEVQAETTEANKVVEDVKPKARKADIDRNRMVACKNVTSGLLIYVSRKTGHEVIWENYGDIEFLDVGELITINSSQSRFLKEPWFMLDEEEDADVIEFLGLTKIYDNMLPIDELDSFFRQPTHEIEDTISRLPKGNKRLVAEVARKYVEEGRIDSIKVIKALERSLQIDLSPSQE